METSSRASTPDRELLWPFLSGPIVWSAYLVVSYLLVEAACSLPLTGPLLLGLPMISVLTLALGVLAIALIFYPGWRAWRELRHHSASSAESDGAFSGPFLAYGGLILNALFLVVMLFTLLPALVLGPCS